MYETNIGGIRWLPQGTAVRVVPEGEYYWRLALDEIGQVVRRIELNGARGVEISVVCAEGNDTEYSLAPLDGHIVGCIEQKSGEDYTISREDVAEGTMIRKSTPDTSIEVLLKAKS